MFSWQQPTFFPPILPSDPDLKLDSSSSTNLGMAVEAGFRWMGLTRFSLDLSFKYGYFHPSYSYPHLRVV